MKKRVLFLLVGLNLLIVSSISMSLAWFLGSARLSVDNFVISIDGDADLKISTSNDKKTAKDSLTSEDIGEMAELIPVTSMRSYFNVNGDGWISDRSTKYPTFLGQYTNGNQKMPNITKTDRGFFSLDLYLWSDKHITVTYDSSNSVRDDNGNFTDPNPIIKSNDEKNEAKAIEIAKEKATKNYKALGDKEMEENHYPEEYRQNIYDRIYNQLLESYTQELPEKLGKIVNSVRFSILDYDNLAREDENDFNSNYIIIDPTKTKDSSPVVFGGRLCTSLTRDYFDYYQDTETHEYKETLFGDVKNNEIPEGFSYNDLYGEALDYDRVRNIDEEPSCFNSGTLKGVRPLVPEKLASFPFYTENSMTPEEADVSVTKNNKKGYLIELVPGRPHHLVLTVYIEGWDLDNLDSTQEGSFDLNIKFRALGEAEFKRFSEEEEN